MRKLQKVLGYNFTLKSPKLALAYKIKRLNMEVLKLDIIEKEILIIRNQKVLLDSSLARLYEVETRAINQAVTRNPEKFPDGYLIELTDLEWDVLRSQTVISNQRGGRAYKPKAFTEKGLYMLATLIRGSRATEITLLIIDTFAKLRELNRAIATIQDLPEDSTKQKTLLSRTGELMAEIIMPDEDGLTVHESEMTLEIGFPFLRIKKTIKKK